jgi:hypothetical protein
MPEAAWQDLDAEETLRETPRTGPAPTPPRPDLSNRRLIAGVTALGLALLFYLGAKSGLPGGWQQPGSAVLHPAAAFGAVLLLTPFLFSLGKRGGHATVPNKLFILHVGASLLGIFLVTVHAAAALSGPPLALLGCLVLLVVSGMVGRVYLAPCMATTFGTKSAPFTAPDPALRERLRTLIGEKRALLARLDPGADEALYSVTLRHWLTAPLMSLAYARLARKEAELIGARQSVPPLQAWWRPLHIALAWAFLAGLILHVVLVTFFAGYVADGREIYWWHLAAW